MNIQETSKVQLDIKTLIGMIIGIVSIAGIWFNLTAEIARLERDLNLVQNKLDHYFLLMKVIACYGLGKKKW